MRESMPLGRRKPKRKSIAERLEKLEREAAENKIPEGVESEPQKSTIASPVTEKAAPVPGSVAAENVLLPNKKTKRVSIIERLKEVQKPEKSLEEESAEKPAVKEKADIVASNTSSSPAPVAEEPVDSKLPASSEIPRATISPDYVPKSLATR